MRQFFRSAFVCAVVLASIASSRAFSKDEGTFTVDGTPKKLELKLNGVIWDNPGSITVPGTCSGGGQACGYHQGKYVCVNTPSTCTGPTRRQLIKHVLYHVETTAHVDVPAVSGKLGLTILTGAGPVEVVQEWSESNDILIARQNTETKTIREPNGNVPGLKIQESWITLIPFNSEMYQASFRQEAKNIQLSRSQVEFDVNSLILPEGSSFSLKVTEIRKHWKDKLIYYYNVPRSAVKLDSSGDVTHLTYDLSQLQLMKPMVPGKSYKIEPIVHGPSRFLDYEIPSYPYTMTVKELGDMGLSGAATLRLN
jgi:hypothetical protein